MQSSVCNIRPVFLFLTAHHFSLAKQQHLHQDVHPQQQTTKSEQITMTEAIYRLQRATVAPGTAWPVTPSTVCLLCQPGPALKDSPAAPLFMSWAYHFHSMQMLTRTPTA